MTAAALRAVYESDLPRVRQYLRAEIGFVKGRLAGDERVLELGAGYGRIVRELAPHARLVTGVDSSPQLISASEIHLRGLDNVTMITADVFAFDADASHDVVACLQNGLSAIKGDRSRLVAKAVDCARPGGVVFFSTYAERFWPHRLAWFREQSDKGLLDPIDEQQTGDGRIVCLDGFEAVSFTAAELEAYGAASGCHYTLTEVDGSSLFLELHKPRAAAPLS